VGSCENLQTRLNKHNTNHSGFTGKTLDWKIMWSEEHAGKAEALKREKQIKTWKSRKMIENMIGKV
jgi:putative endonuclease